jgi:hypothetical protein
MPNLNGACRGATRLYRQSRQSEEGERSDFQPPAWHMEAWEDHLRHFVLRDRTAQ